MEFKVLKRFKSPDGLGPFNIGEKFKTEDEQLAKSLMGAGLIENKKIEQKKEQEDKPKENKPKEDKQKKKSQSKKKGE